MKIFLPCLYAGLSCVGFCFVFELRNWKLIVASSLTGAASWLVYLSSAGLNSEVARNFLATLVVASLAELFARIFKVPATVFVIVGILPLVPGGGIYYTMEALINGNMALFVRKGLETAACAGAIAVGCSLVTSLVRILPGRHQN